MDSSNKKPNDDIVALNTPPHSMEAEQAVLGSIIQSIDAWDKVAEILIEEDFYNRAHRIIFSAIVRLIANNSTADPVTLKSELESNNQLEDVGGFTYIINLARNTPSSSNVSAYANIVRERAVVRELIGAANDIADVSFNPEGRNSKELLDLAETKVFEIAEKRTAANEGPVSVKSALRKTVARIEELAAQDKDVTGVSTGFIDLDKKTTGLQPSDLIIVAARPSMGKCIVSGSLLVHPDTGEMITIDEMVENKVSSLTALRNDFRLCKAKASAFVDDGIKPVFKVKTALGRSIETTITHPFLSGDGWQALAKLAVGDNIAVPRELPIFGEQAMPEHEIKALAYFMSKSNTSNTMLSFNHSNEAVFTDFTTSMAKFDDMTLTRSAFNSHSVKEYASIQKRQFSLKSFVFNTLKKAMVHLQVSGSDFAQSLHYRPTSIGQWSGASALPLPLPFAKRCEFISGNFIRSSQVEDNQASCATTSLTELLQSHDLWAKTPFEKTIPGGIFSLPKAQMTLFLNRLFACDGEVSIVQDSSSATEKQLRVSYDTLHQSLAQQVQHLLLRFGVLATLNEKTHSDSTNYQLEILEPQSLKRFIDTIGMIGYQEILEQGREFVSRQSSKVVYDAVPNSVSNYIRKLKGEQTWQEIFKATGKKRSSKLNLHLLDDCQAPLSREQVAIFADIFDDEYLHTLASSDVYWDRIVEITYTGNKQVYDLTVPDFHNFIAQDICVHNTTFAMNLVENALMLEEKPVLVFSLEMPAEQIMMRMLASLCRINQTTVRTGKLEDNHWAQVQSTMKMLNEKDNLYIDDSSGLTPMEVRTRARKLAREAGGISMIMIDYLQLMRVPSLSDNRTLEISEISRSLKALAKELECPVIALSQLNRGLEQRADKRPINSDLRESGAIEQDADLIMFIYRDEVYNENTDLKGISEIIIGKQRNGPIGTVRLTFQGQFSRFDNYTGPAFSEE